MKQLNPTIFKHFVILIISIFFILSCQDKGTSPLDWPQFKKDNFRSGNSPVDLDLETLGEDFVYTSSQLPVPAWYGPAKEDAYAKSGPLPSMRDYDLAFYPIVVGDNLYFGSSADYAVHCLSAKTGREKWTFASDGPIRIPPVYYEGKLYFGSDDGYAYCIKASTGKLVWKYTPVPAGGRKVINNYALISFWPIRTGILIENDIAYFGASLLPWKESYFCAINIKTGKPDLKNTYVKVFDNLTLEGAMASTGTKIVQPQGRISPIFFDMMTGESKGQLAGTGGCFVLITPEKNIVHPQNSRFKSITESFAEPVTMVEGEGKKKADFMSFKGGKEMVVEGNMSYILSDNVISAYDRSSKKVVWLNRNYQGHRIIISGNILYVGATDTVYAVSTDNGQALWKVPVEGVVYAMATAGDALFASTGEGKIYCFRGGITDNPLYAQNKDKPAEIQQEEEIEADDVIPSLELAAGPYVNTLSKNQVEVHFFTDTPVQCTLDWGNQYHVQNIRETKPATEHRITLDHVRKNFIYNYQIKAGNQETRKFAFDNFFNFSDNHATPDFPATLEDDPFYKTLLDLELDGKGFCVILGADHATIAFDIAKYFGMKVIVFETSNHRVLKMKKKWINTGLYGGKLSVHQVENLSHLPITGDIADLVVSSNFTAKMVDEAIRISKPNGYTTLLDGQTSNSDWKSDLSNVWQTKILEFPGLQVLEKQPYSSAGVWTHQYALPDNSAFGGESLWGSTSTEDFEIQWMGRPGPRFQTDRSGRKPSPLAVDGKMFVQGNERIVGVDAYSGKVIWSKEIPDMLRMNLHRDCSNWAADQDYVYLAVKNNLLKLDNRNGSIAKLLSVNHPSDRLTNYWGFIGLLEDRLIGSVTPKGSHYQDFYGGQGWYDAVDGPLSEKVVSSSIFAISKDGNKDLWNYKREKTVIINSSITISNDQIAFVESRNPHFKLTKSKRADPSLFNRLYLVALDANSGDVLWEKSIYPVPGITTFFMTAGKDLYVILTANGGKYHLYAHDTGTGKLIWDKKQDWFATHHGGHFSRPAVVNNRLIVKPAVYDLNSGELLDVEVPKAGHGCASYALSEQSIFYRGGSVTQFNFDTKHFSKWERLRPDCWISTIPAQGLVLSPEAGGGCSCGNWLETSMVFAPLSRAPISFLSADDEFLDSLYIEIKVKDLGMKVYYTLDGSQPDKQSAQYDQPIVITKSTELNASIYVEKEGKEISFTRNKTFTRLHPAPQIVEIPELVQGTWQFYIKRTGSTGEIHYTTDGTTPTVNASLYSGAIPFSEKIVVKAKTFWIDEGEITESEEINTEIGIPTLNPGVDEAVQPGISWAYYPGKEQKIPDFKTILPDHVGIAKTINTEVAIRKEKFALRFAGFLDIPIDGVYRLYDQSTGRCVVYINDAKQLSNIRDIKSEAILFLEKGLHPIVIEYMIWTGAARINLQIAGPELPKQEIPAGMLYTNLSHERNISL